MPRDDVLAMGPVWLRYAPGALLTVGWLGMLVTPASVKPMVGISWAFSLGCLAAAAALAGGRGAPRMLWGPIGAMALAVAALGVAVIVHPQPLQSMFGAVGQHAGLLLWAAIPLWLYAGAATGTGRAFRITLWSLAALGCVLAVFALLDAAHLYEMAGRYSEEVSGLVESSITLGQLLLLTLGPTLALVIVEDQIWVRVGAGVIAGVEAVALLLSGARGALASLVIAAVLFALWRAWPQMAKPWRAVVRFSLLVAVAAVVLFIAYAAAVGPANPALKRVDELLTGRVAIWHSAGSHVVGHLLIGAGTDRFTAVNQWSLMSGSGTQINTTTSPHNILLELLVAGGVLALGAMLTAWVLVGRSVLRSQRSSSVPMQLIALGVLAWLFSLLIAWTDPSAAAIAAFTIGSVIGAGASARRRDRVSPRDWAVVVALCAGALLVASIGVQLLGMELGWAAESAGTQQGDVASAMARWEQWPDPTFGVAAAQYALAANDTQAEVQLAQELYSRIPWSADADIKVAQISQTLAGGPYASQVPTPEAALEAGRMADPTSGLWDAVHQILSQKK